MAENLDSLTSRFFATIGVVEPAGYQTIEVLLDKWAQPNFGQREYLLLAFSPEAAHEHDTAELVTYGSPLLDTMTEVATVRGNTIHLYLGSLNPTTGRTLEKVRAHVRIPGHILEVGDEQLLLFHHILFRFKISFLGEEREEYFQDVVVDLHTGWTTLQIDEQSLRLNVSREPLVGRGMGLRLSLAEAYQTAKEKLRENMTPKVKVYEERLRTACQTEQKQVSEHYETMIAKMEAGKTHKGADLERLDAKIRATRADREFRLQDLQKRYQLSMEITVVQLALVSYLKAAVPLRIQQGKEIEQNAAVWDSLTRQGYLTTLEPAN